MNDSAKKNYLAEPVRQKSNSARDRLVNLFRKQKLLAGAAVVSLLGIVYWGIVASDRYVSEAHIIIQRANLPTAQTMDFKTMIGDTDAAGRTEQLLLRDYLLSVDMLKTLDERLDLRSHYSQAGRDLISRMWFADAKLERFHRHFLSRVSVDYDDYAGILVIRSQAYDAKTAHAISTWLVQEGERFMNAMANGLANGQIAFLEKQVADSNRRAIDARKKLIDYQNQKGLVSPQGTAENYAAIISRLEAQLAEMQTRRAAMAAYLMPESPHMVEINQQISAVERQIASEKARLAAPFGKTLNSTVEEYQRLQMNADFEQDVYKTALTTLEKGRVEATRMLKKVSVLQSPSYPQYPLEPRRIYNIVVFIMGIFIITGILCLLAAIIRDHKD